MRTNYSDNQARLAARLQTQPQLCYVCYAVPQLCLVGGKDHQSHESKLSSDTPKVP